MTSLNMGLVIPFPGVSTTYVDDINSNFEIIDMHDHISVGLPINQDSILWKPVGSSGVNFQSEFITNADGINFSDDSVVTNLLSLYTLNGDLYFTDGANNQVQITKNGALAVSGTYNGFYGNMTAFNAAASYSSAGQSYTFTSQAATSLYFQDCTTATSYICSGTLSITNNLTLDSTKEIYTDSIFPGTYVSNYAPYTTFYVNNDGQFVLNYQYNVQPYVDIPYDSFLQNTSSHSNITPSIYAAGYGWSASGYTSSKGRTRFAKSISATTNPNEGYIHPFIYGIDPSPYIIGAGIYLASGQANNNGILATSVAITPSDISNITVPNTSIHPLTYGQLYTLVPGALYFIGTTYSSSPSTDAGFASIPIYDYQIIWSANPEDPNGLTDPTNIVVTTVFESFCGASYITSGLNPHPLVTNNFVIGLLAKNIVTGEIVSNYNILLTFFNFYGA